MGRGFTWKSDNLDRDIAVAREAWEFARATIAATAISSSSWTSSPTWSPMA
ncbi:hypothetical protein ACLG6S_15255 [Thermodesulfobacteriota bacterium B35]